MDRLWKEERGRKAGWEVVHRSWERPTSDDRSKIPVLGFRSLRVAHSQCGGSAFSVPTKKVNGPGNAGRFAADAGPSGLPLSVLHVVELKVSHCDYKCRIGSTGRGVKADGGEQHRL